jgi:ribonuclease P/MRP protein subunit RPP40
MRVILNGEGSNWVEVHSEVRQRSLLGPPLFFIFINDLDLAALQVTLTKKNVDDTKLGQIIRDHQDTWNLQV